MSLSILPVDILRLILQHAWSERQHSNLVKVCRKWKHVILSRAFWNVMLMRVHRCNVTAIRRSPIPVMRIVLTLLDLNHKVLMLEGILASHTTNSGTVIESLTLNGLAPLFKFFRVLLRGEEPNAQIYNVWYSRKVRATNETHPKDSMLIPESLMRQFKSPDLLPALATLLIFSQGIPSFAYRKLPHIYWCFSMLEPKMKAKIDVVELDESECACLKSEDPVTSTVIAHPALLSLLRNIDYKPLRVLQEASFETNHVINVMRDHPTLEVFNYCIEKGYTTREDTANLEKILDYLSYREPNTIPTPVQDGLLMILSHIPKEDVIRTLFRCNKMASVGIFQLIIEEIAFPVDVLLRLMIKAILEGLDSESPKVYEEVKERILGSKFCRAVVGLSGHEWLHETARQLCEKGITVGTAYASECKQQDVEARHFAECKKCVKVEASECLVM